MEFKNEYEFLSNFTHSPLMWRGRQFRTVEHAFQAEKTLDYGEQEKIRKVKKPGQAKQLGRNVKLREDWEDIKIKAMKCILRSKFQTKKFAKKLRDTKDVELVETNTWHDNFWGDCICDKCKHSEGKNNLGKLLMEIREEMKLTPWMYPPL